MVQSDARAKNSAVSLSPLRSSCSPDTGFEAGVSDYPIGVKVIREEGVLIPGEGMCIIQ